MINTLFIADHNVNDYPGGAERVDHTVYTSLGIRLVQTSVLNASMLDLNLAYIVSNTIQLSEEHKKSLMRVGNYIILEHDYKMHPSRQPNRYPDDIFPKDELINLGFYKSAKAVLLQSKDHLDCFKANGIEGNLIALQGSIWSDKEIDTLRSLTNDTKTHKYAVIEHKQPLKGTDIAVEFCDYNMLDYDLLQTKSLLDFYKDLSAYSTLVYFPRVKESFCRLVVEARCLQLNVITNKTYGAVKEPWFTKQGEEMLVHLEESTKRNLDIIAGLL